MQTGTVMNEYDGSRESCTTWSNHPAVTRALREARGAPHIFTITPQPAQGTGTGNSNIADSRLGNESSHHSSLLRSSSLCVAASEDWRRTPRAVPSLHTHAPITSTVHLCESPFAGRRATLYMQAYDRPWDGHVHCGADAHTYVQLSALFAETNNAGADEKEQERRADESDRTIGVGEICRRQQRPRWWRALPRRCDGPYRDLCYHLSADAVAFSALLCTLAAAGLRPSRTRLEITHSSLNWVARPVPSDFATVRFRQRQKLNHIPGAWRLGKKDALHRALCDQVSKSRSTAREDSTQGCVRHNTKHPPDSASHDNTDHRGNNSSSTSRNYFCTQQDDRCGDARACAGNSPPYRWFPEGWVLPAEGAAALAAMRAAPAHARFIVKPATAACGRGIALWRGGADAKIILPAAAPPVRAEGGVGSAARARRSNGPTRWVLQRYVDDVYLIHGYKWDLRLYVVVTSYAPVRLYLYQEGLARFATAPYPAPHPAHGSHAGNDAANVFRSTSKPEDNHGGNGINESDGCALGEDGDGAIGSEARSTARRDHARRSEAARGHGIRGHTTVQSDENRETCLQAHLTNFTLNKGAAAAGDAAVGPVPKWSLAALRAHMTRDGWDWEATMTRIHDVLCRVFLSVVCDVRGELESVDRAHFHDTPGGATDTESISPRNGSLRPPCTFRGVSPFFQLYGVDVLLCRPGQRHEASAPSALEPVIMEVNIMPSLSTHYSLLDQHIKGNFIADALTLVGLSTPALKPSAMTKLATTSTKEHGKDHVLHGSRSESAAVDSVCYGDDFLNALRDVDALEACLTAEEERRRAPRFDRLMPTAASDVQYASLLLSGADDCADGSCRSSYHDLDAVLSAWERSRRMTSP